MGHYWLIIEIDAYKMQYIYCIAGNLGGFLIGELAILWKIAKLKSANILFYALLYYAEVLAIAKFKLRQCILMTGSPNLMLTKVSCYAVIASDSHIHACI